MANRIEGSETPTRRGLRALRALLAGGSIVALAVTPGAAQELGEEALEQIAFLTAHKLERSPAQSKIDSRLLYEVEREQLLARLPDLAIARHVGDDGSVLIDVDATVDSDLLGWIETLGGTVHTAFARWEAVRATLPVGQLEALAALEQVRSLRPADVFLTHKLNTTEGDVAHAADVARTQFGVDGSGVKVGAMSDSVDALAALQASGDLPFGVTVLPGQSGNPATSEGTALLEIVHDLAPGAELFFATGRGGQAQMAQNILDLAAAGCTVIVDDLLYVTESVFQDGIIAQAIDEVAASGVAHFTAAGNSGNLASGTSGVWEGDYLGDALPGALAGFGLSAHDFGGGATDNTITVDPPFVMTLQWSDPNDTSANDYDLFLLDPTLTTVLAASTTTQNGSQDPLEVLDSTARNDVGNRLVVVKFAGQDRFLHLNTHTGRLGLATNGQIFGHAAAEGAIAVAAVDVATAGGAVFTGGPANPVEAFSSDGPRRIFFEADGTPVTPESASVSGAPAKGGQASVIRDVPDVAAADGVTTATPGYDPFFGTSAAAPHAAGIGALIKQILSSLDAEGMEQRLERDAADIQAPGPDDESGAGIPLADLALDGGLGFQNDLFSVFLGVSEDGTDCLGPHHSGTGTNIVTFDGLSEPLDVFTDGTIPFAAELQTDPDEGGNGLVDIAVFVDAVEENLYPEPLSQDFGCLEVGAEDPLESESPMRIVDAQLQFFSGLTPIGAPIDVTPFFEGEAWDGVVRIPIDDQPILDNATRLELRAVAEDSTSDPIFVDSFESGDTSQWSNQLP